MNSLSREINSPAGDRGRILQSVKFPIVLAGIVWPEIANSYVKSGPLSLLVDVMLTDSLGGERERFTPQVAGHFCLCRRALEEGYFGSSGQCGIVI